MVELLLDHQWVADTTLELKQETRMTPIQQPTPNHKPETFDSAETQFFECEALPADHPEIQARERARRQRLADSASPTQEKKSS